MYGRPSAARRSLPEFARRHSARGNIFPVPWSCIGRSVKSSDVHDQPLAYFVLVPCLIGIAGVLAHFIPQSRDTLHVPLESLRGLLAVSVLFSHAVVSYFYFQTGVWTNSPTRFYAFLGSGPVTLFFFSAAFSFGRNVLPTMESRGTGAFWQRARAGWYPFITCRWLLSYSLFWQECISSLLCLSPPFSVSLRDG